MINNGATYANSPAVAVAGNDHVFTVQSPAVAFHDAILWATGLSTSTVVTNITSLSAHQANTPVSFKLPTKGFQAINDMRLDGNLLRMVGSTVDADGQTGNDIYHLISSASLTNINHTCNTVQETVSIINPVVSTYTVPVTALNYVPSYVTVDTGSTNYTIMKFCGDIISDIANITSERQTLEIFPNPSFDEITVKSTEAIKSLIITNTLGQVIIRRSERANRAVITIRDLPGGIYYLHAAGQSRKFVKL